MMTMATRYVNGMPTSEVTPVTILYIHPPQHGHKSVPVMVMNDQFTLLRYSYLKFDLEKSKDKVKGHIIDPVSNQCISFLFHANHTNHC